MTHDELLAKLNQVDLNTWTRTIPVFNALTAVVDLHKPLSSDRCYCDPYNEYDNGYPCPTIQAIEKELND